MVTTANTPTAAGVLVVVVVEVVATSTAPSSLLLDPRRPKYNPRAKPTIASKTMASITQRICDLVVVVGGVPLSLETGA
jgi:hypothetical protein